MAYRVGSAVGRLKQELSRQPSEVHFMVVPSNGKDYFCKSPNRAPGLLAEQAWLPALRVPPNFT